MRIGFTGTQKGMTDAQSDTVRQILGANFTPGSVFIHGGCIGADDEAAMQAGNIGYELWCLPSDIDNKRGNIYSFVTLPQQPPLDRNIHIVQMCEYLIAVPKHASEQQRSGTWHTIRRARALDRNHVIVWPSGVAE